MKSVGVIGAGLSGLSAIKHLISEPGKFEVKCFDRAAKVGGEGVYMPTTENNAFGARANAIYDHLSFREASQLLDHDFTEGVPLFPFRQDMEDYIQSYADKYKLRNYVQLNTQVEKVKPVRGDGENITWHVTSRSLTDGVQSWTFDAIVVCTSMYHKPILPDIPGREEFGGSMIHSYQHRTLEEYRDRRVVVVGGGPSGNDIALGIMEVAKYVYCSGRKWYLSDEAYTNNERVGLIQRFTSTSMMLEDGREIEVDDVIFCTGFSREFPFMDETAHVKSEQLRISPLYKSIVHTEFPSSLFFVGLKEFCSYHGTVTVQVRLITSILLGNADLPSVEVMNQEVEKEVATVLKAGLPPRLCHVLGPDQARYIAELEKLGRLEKSPVSVWKAMESLIGDYISGNFDRIRKTQYIIKDDQHFDKIIT